MERICRECQGRFYVPASKVRRGRGVWCSRACVSRAHSAERKCVECGQVFRAHLSAVKVGKGRYCSRTCVIHAQNRGVAPKVDPAIRFWRLVDKTPDPRGCWLWRGFKDVHGYGDFAVSTNIRMPAHRFALATREVVEPRRHVLHSCDNPSCVNPDHLRQGTQAENMSDACERNRIARGTRHGAHKLDDSQVQAIRLAAAAGEIQWQIADRFGVSQMTVSDIVRRRTWSWLAD